MISFHQSIAWSGVPWTSVTAPSDEIVERRTRLSVVQLTQPAAFTGAFTYGGATFASSRPRVVWGVIHEHACAHVFPAEASAVLVFPRPIGLIGLWPEGNAADANIQPAFPLLVQTLCDLAPVGKDIEILFCWKKRRKVSDCLGVVERPQPWAVVVSVRGSVTPDHAAQRNVWSADSGVDSALNPRPGPRPVHDPPPPTAGDENRQLTHRLTSASLPCYGNTSTRRRSRTTSPERRSGITARASRSRG